MNATLTVKLMHRSSLASTRWCEPIGWEPTNTVEGCEWMDGGWWGDGGQEAGLVWFGDPTRHLEGEEIEVTLADLRVVSCGDMRSIVPVEA